MDDACTVNTSLTNTLNNAAGLHAETVEVKQQNVTLTNVEPWNSRKGQKFLH
jgi:hypothetical protein